MKTRLFACLGMALLSAILVVFPSRPASAGGASTAGSQLEIIGKDGAVYKFRSAFCFEPQGFPDSPNHPNFPTTELKPGELYKNKITYKFSVPNQ